ncbi:MAG: hypothetical protein WC328_14170, partial [Kiritimatiellia bacterium]
GAPCYYCAPCEADEAQVCIGVGCSTVWDWCDPEPDPDDPGLTHAGDEARDPCGDRCEGDCAPLCSCDSLGSFTFRASLGATPNGTPAGAVWISLDAPQPLTPALFRVLAAPGVVTNATAQGFTVAAHERNAAVETVPGTGVCLSVYEAGSQTLRSRWTFSQPSAEKIRVVRESGSGDGDVTYAYFADSGSWTRTDNLAGIKETLVSQTLPDDVKQEVRLVTEADGGAVLSETVTERRLFGGRARVTRRSESGPSGFSETLFSYWEDPANSRRTGKPKLRTGNGADWQYTFVDDLGRPSLTAGPLDGSPPGHIASIEPSDLAALAYGAGFQCLATLYGYTPDPAAGDSCHPADRDKPREKSVFAVYADTFEPVPVSRTRYVYARGEDAEYGYPTLTVETLEDADPSAPGLPSGCRRTLRVAFAGAEAGADLPAVLWDLPLFEVDGDFVTNTHDYAFGAYDPASRAFTGDPLGTCLRTVAATSASPLAEITVSEPARGLTHLRQTWLLTRQSAALLSWEASAHDADGRERVTCHSDGTSASNDYGGSCGCRLTAATGRDGGVTEYWRDPADPCWSASAVLSALPGTYEVTETFTDGLGRATNTVRCVWEGSWLQGGARAASPAPLATSRGYPAPGVQTTLAPSGLLTRSAEFASASAVTNVSVAAGVTNTVVRIRGGGTVTLTEWDGVWTRETRAASCLSGGIRRETVVTESSDCPPVTNSVTDSDALGRVLSVSTPAFGGGRLTASNFYAGASSRLVRSTRPGQPDTLYEYDGLGRPAVSALDVNANGEIDREGPDRVSLSLETYEEDAAGDWWQVSASASCPDTGSAVPVTNTLSRSRLTGLGVPASQLAAAGVLTAQSETVDANSATARVHTVTDAANATVWTVSETPGQTLPAVQKTVAGHLAMAVSSSSVTNRFIADGFGRQTAATDGRGNISVTLYDSAGQACLTAGYLGGLASVPQITAESALLTNRTATARDALGRATAVTDASGWASRTAYDGAGNMIAQWEVSHPVAYGYDTANRKVSMRTFRGLNHVGAVPPETGGDLTQWLYDAATGLCTNKVYADGSRESYTYTPEGRLLRTTHPGGKWKENLYDPVTGDLSGIVYSDDTPSVIYERDRLGRVVPVTDASGANTFARSRDGAVLSESFRLQDETFTLHECRDPATGQSSGYALVRSNTVTAASSVVTGADFSRDGAGRVSGVSVKGVPAPFIFSYLPGTDLVKSLAMPNGVVRETVWDARLDLPASVTHTNAAGTVLSHRAYPRDALARVTTATRSRLVNGVYETLARDMIYSGVRSELSVAIVDWDMDKMYNYSVDDIGSRTGVSRPGNRYACYAANTLNQYTGITDCSTYPYGGFYPSHDPDGNQTLIQTEAGVWDVAYNAVSRPVLFSGGDGVQVQFAYDHRGRCCERVESRLRTVISGGHSVSYWETVSHERYLYRGYLRIAALDMLNNAALIHAAVWDPTEPAATRPLLLQTPSGCFTYAFDQAKNVTELFDSAGGIAAVYDHGPFGEDMAAAGPAAALNPFRFSSEVWDGALALVCYNWRHYN